MGRQTICDVALLFPKNGGGGGADTASGPASKCKSRSRDLYDNKNKGVSM